MQPWDYSHGMRFAAQEPLFNRTPLFLVSIAAFRH